MHFRISDTETLRDAVKVVNSTDNGPIERAQTEDLYKLNFWISSNLEMIVLIEVASIRGFKTWLSKLDLPMSTHDHFC